MTEKRYSLVYYADKGGAFIKNNETGTEWYHDSRASLLEIVNELNELAEKNNELQIQCNLLREQANEFHRGAIENANKVGKLEKENKELKNDEKQLSIDFLGYKMKLRKVLQRRYDKAKGQTLYADVFLEIAEEMGIDLE